ncbi:hypothetical protein KL937_003266 [Ogataea polymorpha]|uniref:uncharacterized protein n=1 Tax=Ogataea polymorpha TaxID=460523 RepID=UPI0007F428C5|nr:uncharacterized protein OGAPODRAFT_93140 [Ogataea polymorpha]KAG7879505.1 hypothetical protein KL937_003266 [Ogataea polymorpha]KAG7915924.1 hypothetical protein KL927_003389 [Ogataea polymorpha]KAG7935113.1 hypothetical protein KL904_003445 [Ogataea polymorpha]OBA17915.1 hypothetical protein OGAPODRAFT_93140 [Ogataea polymorpha]
MASQKPASATRQVYTVYTDGACSFNHDPSRAKAGYGVFFGDDDPRNTAAPLVGPVQTNNRAELSAIKQALETILEEFEFGNGEQYQILTDSEYCVKCILVWSKTWQKNGWKNSKKQPVANRDLIEAILGLIDRINEEYSRHGFGRLTVDWVRGHANNHGNEMADALAREGASMEWK